MNPELWPAVESALAAAVELPEPERLAFVGRSCTSPEMRAEVESLLVVYRRAETFLSAPEAPSAGRRFGSYRLCVS